MRHIISCVICFIFIQVIHAQDELPLDITKTYYLPNVTIIQSPGKTIENGSVLIKDGLIEGVGKNIKIPADAQVLKTDSMYVYAGFISSFSHIGVPKPEKKGSRPKIKDPGNPTNEQAGITPEKQVRSVLKPSDGSISSWREQGFTLVHSVPRGRVFPGSGSLLLTHDENADKLLFDEDVSLYANFNTTWGVYPGTIIAIMAKWRQIYRQAELAQKHEKIYASSPKGVSRPSYDQATQSFYPVINKEKVVYFKASKGVEISRVFALQKDLGFKFIPVEVKQAYTYQDRLKANNQPVLFSLKLPEWEEEKKKKKDAAKKDKEKKKEEPKDPEKMALEKKKKESATQYLSQAAQFSNAGIPIGFSMLDIKSKDFKKEVKKLMAHGLEEKDAIAALTTTPAKMLGVDDVCGTVEKGKMANLMVCNKPYFDEKSQVTFVFVEGSKFAYDIKKEKKKKKGDESTTEESVSVIGVWEFEAKAMGQNVGGEMDIKMNGDRLEGNLTTMGSTVDIKSIVLDGDQLSFSFTIPDGGQAHFSGTVDGETINGNVDAGNYGNFKINAKLVSSPE